MQQERAYRIKRKPVGIDRVRREQQAKATRRTIFYVGLFLVLTILFIAVCFLVFFKLETVVIEGSSRYSEEEILSVFGVETGENLYSFNAGELETKLVKNLPYLSEVKIDRDLPSTIVIRISEKKPDMYVEISGDRYLLTDNMQILEYTSDPSKLYGLLRLDMEPETVFRCIVGEKLLFSDARTGDVLTKAFADINEIGITNRVDYIDANNRFGIYIGLDGKYQLYMGDIEEFDTKLAFAMGILEKLSTIPESKEEGIIDVSEINKGVFIPKQG